MENTSGLHADLICHRNLVDSSAAVHAFEPGRARKGRNPPYDKRTLAVPHGARGDLAGDLARLDGASRTKRHAFGVQWHGVMGAWRRLGLHHAAIHLPLRVRRVPLLWRAFVAAEAHVAGSRIHLQRHVFRSGRSRGRQGGGCCGSDGC